MDGNTARVRSIDVFKGVAILIIVFCHICFATKSDVGSPNAVIQTLYLGLMVFLMISGYFYRPERSFAENMKKRVTVLLLALVICCVALTVISYLWAVLCSQPIQQSDLLDGFEFMFCLHKAFDPLDTPTVWEFCGNGVGYYFLWLMLGSFVIFYALEGIVRKDIRLRAVLIAALIAMSIAYRELYPYNLPFYLHLSMMGAAFMFTGSAFKQYGVFERIGAFEWRSWRYWVPFVLSMVLSLVLVFFLPPNIRFDQMMFGDYGGYSAVPYYVEAVVASVSMMYFCTFFSRIPLLSDAFVVCGKHSLGLLLLHGTIAAMMVMPFYTLSRTVWLPEELGVVPRTAIAAVTVVICLVICIYGPAVLERLKGVRNKD